MVEAERSGNVGAGDGHRKGEKKHYSLEETGR